MFVYMSVCKMFVYMCVCACDDCIQISIYIYIYECVCACEGGVSEVCGMKVQGPGAVSRLPLPLPSQSLLPSSQRRLSWPPALQLHCMCGVGATMYVRDRSVLN
jgi:hypothetical protein